MTSLYRRLRLRHGLRIGTGHTDWQFVYRCVLLVVAVCLAVQAAYLEAELRVVTARVDALEAKLLRNTHRMASCLNAGPVGFESRQGKQVWIVCGRAEEIVVDEI